MSGVVDETGHAITLRGVNLGGWLLWEGWMWGVKLNVLATSGHTQSAIEERLALAAGTNAMCSFREGVRERFITEDDIAAISRRRGFESRHDG